MDGLLTKRCDFINSKKTVATNRTFNPTLNYNLKLKRNLADIKISTQ